MKNRRVLLAITLCLGLNFACASATGDQTMLEVPTVAANAAGVARLEGGLTYAGMCDGSASAPLDDKTFIVASDEADSNQINRLAVYRTDQGGAPVKTIDLKPTLVPKPEDTTQHDPKNAEADIEGAARIGNRIYWIASHGLNKNGKPV